MRGFADDGDASEIVSKLHGECVKWLAVATFEEGSALSALVDACEWEG